MRFAWPPLRRMALCLDESSAADLEIYLRQTERWGTEVETVCGEMAP